MKRNRNAAILIVFALILAIGAYILLSNPEEESPIHRADVTPPAEVTKAPSWVGTGQMPTPDYSSSSMEAQNATPLSTNETMPKKETRTSMEIREDSMVSISFVESLSDFILLHFEPYGDQGKPMTSASTKALNMYFGQEMDGFNSSGNNIQSARKILLDYAFTPTMITTLYNLYTPVFMNQIVESATSDEREFKNGENTEIRTLTNAETATMLRLNAIRIQQTASIFRSIAADPTITEMAAQYLGLSKSVERANIQLQNAITDNTNVSSTSQRLKQAIQQREKIKTSIISRLKQTCRDCKDSDLFYLAQWAYRRVLNDQKSKLPTFVVAADVLDDLAGRFQTKATELE